MERRKEQAMSNAIFTQPKSNDLYVHKTINAVGSSGARHYHSTFEVYYMKEGSCSYFIDNKSYEVRAGDFILIPEGVIHKTIYSKSLYTRWLLNCSTDSIPKGVLPLIPNMIYLYRNPDIVKDFEYIYEKIMSEYAGSGIFKDEILSCLIHELFYLFARNSEHRAKVETGNIFVEQTVKYIQENYASEITLPAMARMRSVSPEHLSRTFKKETGFGFSEYLTLVRLQKAEYMLKNEPGKSVSDVAYACGFNDSNYFSDKYKKAYGVSPSRTRKSGKCQSERQKSIAE